MKTKAPLNGTCHCGTVKWQYPLALESVTACNCTLCRKYGALWAYGFVEEGISVVGLTDYYERGAKHNQYHFCKKCGCVTHYQANKRNDQNQIRIAVNLRLIDDPTLIENLPIDHFEGLISFEDLPRDHRHVKDMWF